MSISVPYLMLMACYGNLAWLYHQARDTERRTLVVLFTVGVTLFFFGLRGLIMHDWFQYYRIFLELDPARFSLDFECTEKGFAVLMFLCKSYYPNYHFFVFVVTLLETLLLTRFLVRHTRNMPLALMLAMGIGMMGVLIDLLRNALSICIFLNALDYLRDRKPWRYFAVCTVAMLFHNSAILYFPLYFLLHRRVPTRIYAALFVFGIIICVLRIPLFVSTVEFILNQVDPQLNLYLKVYLNAEENAPAPINFVFLERVVSGAMALWYMPRLRAMRPDAEIYINAFFVYLLTQLLGYEFVMGAGRIAHLFEFGQWIVWFDLYQCLTTRGNQRLLLLVACLYCMLRILGQTKQKPLAQYENVLFETQSFQERQSLFYKTFKK